VKILVTGGAGFIGSHLCDRLLAEGHSVICADDLSLGRKANIAHNLGNPRFVFARADVSSRRGYEGLFKGRRFDCVFHLAANSDIQAGGECPEIDLRRTFMTTFVTLELMRQYGVKRLVFASTSAIYGESDKPLNEDTGPFRPVSLYGAAKLSAESWISAFSENFGIRSWILRFPNVIGPRATHGVIFDFIGKLRANPRRLLILGNGKQCKPYLHVSDLVDAMVFVWKKAQGRVSWHNIAGSGATTVDEIARLTVAAMGLKKVKFAYTGSDRGWKGDVPRFSYDLRKIKKLGWKATMASTAAVARAAREIAGEARKPYGEMP